MSEATNSNIPSPSSPFLIGRPETISPAWWAFLLAIFQRTGGPGAPIPSTEIDFTPIIYSEVPTPAYANQEPPGQVAYQLIVQDEPPAAVASPYIPPDLIEDIFTAGVNFTAGVTTALALSKAYSSPANVMVHFDGVFQATDQYTISGNTITFTSAIPVGTLKVYARG